MSEGAQIAGSVISAFLIGAGTSAGVGLLAGGGKLNTGATIGICAAGLIAAAKDYRSLMKLPPLRNGSGDTDPPFKP